MRTIEPFYAEVGRRVQKLRDKQKLSQEALGRMLAPDMTRASIANIEAGKQRILAHTLVDLAIALAVPITELLPHQGQTKQLLLQDDLVSTKKIAAELAEKLKLPPKELKKLTAEIEKTARRKK
jgi:transcriptional regulator with XRE-family HTH domain